MANRPPTADELNDVKQDTVQWPAKAHRVTQIDQDGNDINLNNPLPVTDYFFEVVKGSVPGSTTEFKFGRSNTVTTTESVIWDEGGNYTFLETAETLDIVSDDTEDNAAGLGARIVIVYGLDSNYIEISEAIVMTGTAPVTTINSYLRTFRMLVFTSGTNDAINDANQGTISATTSVGVILQAKMLPHNGQTLMSVYTVPAGKTAYITGLSLSAGQGKQCLFKAKFRNGPLPSNAFSVKYSLDLYETAFTTNLSLALKVPEKIDILITGQTAVGTVDATVSYGFILEENI